MCLLKGFKCGFKFFNNSILHLQRSLFILLSLTIVCYLLFILGILISLFDFLEIWPWGFMVLYLRFWNLKKIYNFNFFHFNHSPLCVFLFKVSFLWISLIFQLGVWSSLLFFMILNFFKWSFLIICNFMHYLLSDFFILGFLYSKVSILEWYTLRGRGRKTHSILTSSPKSNIL